MVEKEITNTLLISSGFINNKGLLNGKLGIAAFLFYLSRKKHERIHTKYAETLIDEVFEAVSDKTPLDFENGLAGIGWGIEYLVKNNYLDGDTNVILEDIDVVLYNNILKNNSISIGFKDGIIGYGLYFLQRISSQSKTIECSDTVLSNAIALIIEILYEKRNVLNLFNLENTEKFHGILNYCFSLFLFIEVKRMGYTIKKNDEMLSVQLKKMQQLAHSKSYEFLKLIGLLLKEYIISNKKETILDIDTEVDFLFDKTFKVDREKIIFEVQNDLKYNYSIGLQIGILYFLLYQLTNNKEYLTDIRFWKEYNQSFYKDMIYHIKLNPNTYDLGLYKGIAGIGLFNLLIEDLTMQ